MIDKDGGKWVSEDKTGKSPNTQTLQWTASKVGTNKITYTSPDGSGLHRHHDDGGADSLSGRKDKDLTYTAGTQGAGMDLTITVNPTTVSFQALEIIEDTCPATAATGYFATHPPGSHTAKAGAGNWSGIGAKNDVGPDTADSSGWPAPWAVGGYTWAIPVRWRLVGKGNGTSFAAKSNQVITITADGTTTVTKLGASTDPRKP